MSLQISPLLKAVGQVSSISNVTTTYQGNQSFSAALNEVSLGTSGLNSQVSGSLKESYIIATGGIGSDGTFHNFSDQQIQSEMDDAKSMSKAAYQDTLNSFLVLAQANQSADGSDSYSATLNRGLDNANGLDGVTFGGTLTFTSSPSSSQSGGAFTDKIKID